jgi:hypothetical protein
MFKILGIYGHRLYSNGKVHPIVNVVCLTCGTEQVMVKQNAIKSNRLNGQHCAQCINTTFHRMTNTRIWSIWQGLKWRAQDQLDKNYGGRGITMCPEWEDFKVFYADMSETYQDNLTIERIDANRPYSKENCRWATNMEQQSNKRNNRVVIYKGEQMHLAELCRRSGCSKMMLVMRLNRGMTADEAVADCALSLYGKSQQQKNVQRREKRMSMT